jgi:hypothetical protein
MPIRYRAASAVGLGSALGVGGAASASVGALVVYMIDARHASLDYSLGVVGQLRSEIGCGANGGVNRAPGGGGGISSARSQWTNQVY